MAVDNEKTIHVIVIEDNRHDIVAYRRVIERSNARIQATYFTRAEDALAKMSESEESGTVDVLITDNRLPGINGLDLCRIIRENDSRTPLILLVGDGFTKHQQLAVEIGIDECLNKEDFLREPRLLVEHILRLASLRR